VNRKNNWRKRQIILEPELVTELFNWHGGQFSPLYSLASTGQGHLVSLSMIDGGLRELELDIADLKKKKDKNSKKLLKECKDVLGNLDLVRNYWPEHSADWAGMGLEESDYEYDHKDWGYDADEEEELGE
jgi:hypothetical protein